MKLEKGKQIDLESIETERKFLIEITGNLPEDTTETEIYQTYLKTKNEEEETRLRKRGKNGQFNYFHTSKGKLQGNSRTENERQISYEE